MSERTTYTVHFADDEDQILEVVVRFVAPWSSVEDYRELIVQCAVDQEVAELGLSPDDFDDRWAAFMIRHPHGDYRF